MARSALNTLFIAVLSAALLSGCGFQLRGGVELKGVQSVRISATNETVREELAEFLRDGGVRLVQREDEPHDAVLTVDSERYDRRVLSIDPNTGKAREYELAYTVEFDLADAEGKALVKRREVRLVRDFVFDADAVIGKSREEGVLRNEMRRDAVQQIIRRIRATLNS